MNLKLNVKNLKRKLFKRKKETLIGYYTGMWSDDDDFKHPSITPFIGKLK